MLATLLLALVARSPVNAPTTAFAGVDLAKKYPATIDWVEGALGRDWTCAPDDVWSVSSVKLQWNVGGQKLLVESGSANVVFGHENKSVLWAVVLPDKPGKLTTSMPGDGSDVYNVWLRLHPALVGDLFPAATVTKNGGAAALTWARRIAIWKMNANWQVDNQPVVPWKHSLSVDLETKGGTRRFFSIDTKEQVLKYEPYFEKRALPWLAPISKENALEAFDDVAGAFDKDYPKFILHPEYVWEKAAAEQRKRAGSAKTCYEVAAALAELLKPLDDLHIDVTVDGEWVPAAIRPRPRNGNWNGVRAQLTDVVDTKHDCFHGRTKDDVGYLNVYQLNDKELPKAADEALERLGDTWALIVDLRFNGGGDEVLAQQVAARFLDQERIYSVNRYRNGPKHDQCGPWLERKCTPRGPWRYESPVILLQGRRTMSSAESMALMFAQCPQVTVMGDKTAGSSANPRMVETKGKIKVRLPRWDDRDPQKNVIEGKGIPPKVLVAAKPEDFTDTSDPVLAKALETLRAIPEDERKSGNRSAKD